MFLPPAVKNWTDKYPLTPEGDTALCPKCGIDSVIGSESGYSVTEEFLRTMNEYDQCMSAGVCGSRALSVVAPFPCSMS
jgi:hypothetical protein